MNDYFLFILFFVIIIISIILICKLSKSIPEKRRELDRNITYIILAYTIFVAASSAGLTKFLLMDYLEVSKKYEKELKDKEDKLIQENIDFYKQRIEYLQKEISDYIFILSNIEGTKQFFDKKLAEKNEEILDKDLLIASYKLNETKETLEKVKENLSYKKEEIIKEYSAYKDEVAGISIGISHISTSNEISGIININGKEENFSSIAAGKIWTSNYQNKTYEILVKQISFVNGICTILISEKKN
jgi:hypothetical protein